MSSVRVCVCVCVYVKVNGTSRGIGQGPCYQPRAVFCCLLLPPPPIFLSLSLSLSHTQTHTHSEKLVHCYIAMGLINVLTFAQIDLKICVKISFMSCVLLNAFARLLSSCVWWPCLMFVCLMLTTASCSEQSKKKKTRKDKNLQLHTVEASHVLVFIRLPPTDSVNVVTYDEWINKAAMGPWCLRLWAHAGSAEAMSSFWVGSNQAWAWLLSKAFWCLCPHRNRNPCLPIGWWGVCDLPLTDVDASCRLESHLLVRELAPLWGWNSV